MGQSVTEAIVARLAKNGVKHIFGVPGGECNLDFIAAADKLGVKFVLTRNETAACIMASVSAELTGATGVAMTTRGPGLAAAANGAAYAYLDRAPVMIIADGYEDNQTNISHQRIDQAAMLAPVTKASSLLRSADPLAEVEALLDAAHAHPPGPVYLEVAGSHIRRDVPQTAAKQKQAAAAKLDEVALAKAKDMIANAKRPLIVAGLQSRTPEAAAALRAFVAKTGCPVMLTYKAKGVVSEHDPLVLGHYMGGVAEEAAMSAADLLLLYGNDPVEGPPNKWKYDAIPSVELTEHAFEFPLYKATMSVIGPIKDALGQLASSMKPQWSAGQLADFKQSIFTAGRVKKGAGVSPQDIIDAAIATLPADTRITIDAGAHMLPVLHLMRVAEPNQSLISRGLSTMGFAVPAAIASCLADPDRRTVAFTGDGGVMMCLGEFGTAMQEGAKPIVVVFNDSCLTLIGVKQHRRQLAPAGVGFVDADFAKIAAGFGWHTTRVDKAADLQGAFKAALASDKPALIDVLINPEEYEAQILALRG